MDERHSEVARRFRAGLEAIYGPRLKALYACAADEEGAPGLDAYIVVDGARPIEDIEKTSGMTGDLVVQSGVVIWRTFVDAADPALRGWTARSAVDEIPAA